MKKTACMIFVLLSANVLADKEIMRPVGNPIFCQLPTVVGETNECGTTLVESTISGDNVTGFSSGYGVSRKMEKVTVPDDYVLQELEVEIHNNQLNDKSALVNHSDVVVNPIPSNGKVGTNILQQSDHYAYTVNTGSRDATYSYFDTIYVDNKGLDYLNSNSYTRFIGVGNSYQYRKRMVHNGLYPIAGIEKLCALTSVSYGGEAKLCKSFVVSE